MKNFFFPVLVFIISCSPHKVLKVQNGLLDLREIDLTNDSYLIKGNFGFVYGKFIDKLEEVDTYFETPSFWDNQEVGNKKVAPYGIATYTLKILTNKGQIPLSILLTEVGNSCEIYVNNHLVDSMGKIGSSPEDSIADTKLLTIPLHHKTIEHFITIYVSSFHNSHMSGIGGEIILGSKRNIINIKNYLSARDILFAGAILALGLLHLFLAIVSRNDITLWSMSVYCIWAFLAAPLSQSKLIFYIPLTWEWKMKIIYSSGTLAAASVSLGILYLFKEDMNKKIASLQLILAILHSTCILVNPIHIFSEIAKQYLYVITFFFFYTLYVLVKATLKKRKNSIFGIILSSVFILSVLYKFIWKIYFQYFSLSVSSNPIF